MKIRALTTKEIDYVLICQKDEPVEDQIVFKLKPLSARQDAVLKDKLKVEYTREFITGLQKDVENINDDTKLELLSKIKNLNEQSLDTLAIGLVGWSNFKDDDGNEVPFSKDMDENISKIPGDFRMELSNKIAELSTLTESERKN